MFPIKQLLFADTDNVSARGNVGAGRNDQSCVGLAGGVLKKRAITDSRVTAAGGVVLKRCSADARIRAADGVAVECLKTHGHVAEASRVANERCPAAGRVGVDGSVVKKGEHSAGCVCTRLWLFCSSADNDKIMPMSP